MTSADGSLIKLGMVAFSDVTNTYTLLLSPHYRAESYSPSTGVRLVEYFWCRPENFVKLFDSIDDLAPTPLAKCPGDPGTADRTTLFQKIDTGEIGWVNGGTAS